jgi:hypothetical protein
LLAGSLIGLSGPIAAAQDQSSFAKDIITRVAIDPTTYAPGVLTYTSMRLDWESSQPFFQRGWLELNPRYTITGRSNDVPLGYAAGNRRILADSLATVELSIVNNVTDQLIERVLVQRYPTHRKALRALGWVERVAFASYLSYLRSSSHFEQWQRNKRLAGEMFSGQNQFR